MTKTQGQGEQKGGINIVSVYSRAVRRHKHAWAHTHTLTYAIAASRSVLLTLCCCFTHVYTHAHTQGVCDPSQKNER